MRRMGGIPEDFRQFGLIAINFVLIQKTINENEEMRVVLEGFKTPVVGHDLNERKRHPVENKVL